MLSFSSPWSTRVSSLNSSYVDVELRKRGLCLRYSSDHDELWTMKRQFWRGEAGKDTPQDNINITCRPEEMMLHQSRAWRQG